MQYGLIGEKLGHSYSKEIHEKIGRYGYELKEIPRDNLASFFQKKDFKGINVTIPYKEECMPYLDYIDDSALKIGAVNTVVNKDGKLSGYNTDYYGLKSLIEHSGYSLSGKKVLILGTGGTSKTAWAVCKDLGAADIYKVSRKESEETITYEAATSVHKDADFIVNTTPSGMYPNIDAQPIDLSYFTKLEALFDAVYNPSRTKLMLQAESLKIGSFGGLWMLVCQAIVACEFFTGKPVDKDIIDTIFKEVKGNHENIVLIGMPSVGKTTIGKILSKKTGKKFFDTDDLIVAREGRSIPDIFSTDGETYFRKVESEVIKETSSLSNCVIATGGGAILNPKNVEVLKAFGKIFLLQRPLESLKPTDDRPLSKDMDKLKKLYEERMPIYKAAADVEIDACGGIDATIEQIIK